jgi:hypothetical protein
MNTIIEARIARVARVRGLAFDEAARVVARAGVRRRAAKRRLAERLTRARAMWHWRRDFE